MKKIDFQKNIAQLYIDVDKVKNDITEQVHIKSFSDDITEHFEKINPLDISFFKEEVEVFKSKIEEKKSILLSEYDSVDLDKYLEEKAEAYFMYTEQFMKVEPNFYDSFISIKPTWKKDYIKLQEYLSNINNDFPHVKILQDILYKSLKEESSYANEINYGNFDIATDIKSTFKILKEIQDLCSAFIQINFLAIDPAFIPKFDKEQFKKVNNLKNNKVNNYLDSKVIASIEKGSLSPNDSPVNIMKIFLNDKFINNINYHYIDSISGEKITITQVSKKFLKNC